MGDVCTFPDAVAEEAFEGYFGGGAAEASSSAAASLASLAVHVF